MMSMSPVRMMVTRKRKQRLVAIPISPGAAAFPSDAPKTDCFGRTP
jgi:hypothetical protein